MSLLYCKNNDKQYKHYEYDFIYHFFVLIFILTIIIFTNLTGDLWVGLWGNYSLIGKWCQGCK